MIVSLIFNQDLERLFIAASKGELDATENYAQDRIIQDALKTFSEIGIRDRIHEHSICDQHT